jgi:hypothetical protein
LSGPGETTDSICPVSMATKHIRSLIAIGADADNQGSRDTTLIMQGCDVGKKIPGGMPLTSGD